MENRLGSENWALEPRNHTPTEEQLQASEDPVFRSKVEVSDMDVEVLLGKEN